MSEIEAIWGRAKELSGNRRDRRRPGPSIAALLLSLLRQGSAHGSELARRINASQPNVTAVWLPKLQDYGFVQTAMEHVRGTGVRGNGWRGTGWELTAKGHRLATLIAEEEDSDVAA
jgi:DNA-binding PadR family transcriptional regulator